MFKAYLLESLYFAQFKIGRGALSVCPVSVL